MSIGVRYMQNPYIAFCDQCPDWTEGTRSYGAPPPGNTKPSVITTARCHNPKSRRKSLTDLIWPFTEKTTSQFHRIDQGWDLQATVGTPVLAVASGVITYAHDIGGFGDPYPVLTLDTPDVNGKAVYYGHQHPEVAEGTHVAQGQLIAHAAQIPGGNANNLPGWLEIGWWNNGPTGDGQAMYNKLVNANIWQKPATGGNTVDLTEKFAVVASPDGNGGWKFQRDGGCFAFGGAKAFPEHYTMMDHLGNLYAFPYEENGQTVNAYPGLAQTDKIAGDYFTGVVLGSFTG